MRYYLELIASLRRDTVNVECVPIGSRMYSVQAGGSEVGIGEHGECHALADELRRDAALTERVVSLFEGDKANE